MSSLVEHVLRTLRTVERVTRPEPASPRCPDLATWLEPAVWTALTDHQPSEDESATVWCYHPSDDTFWQFGDWQEWREHVSPDITQRMAAALPDYPARSGVHQ